MSMLKSLLDNCPQHLFWRRASSFNSISASSRRFTRTSMKNRGNTCTGAKPCSTAHSPCLALLSNRSKTQSNTCASDHTFCGSLRSNFSLRICLTIVPTTLGRFCAKNDKLIAHRIILLPYKSSKHALSAASELQNGPWPGSRRE